MFSVYLTNFSYALGVLFPSIEAAKEAGIKCGFEFAVYDSKMNMHGYYTTFGGWHPAGS